MSNTERYGIVGIKTGKGADGKWPPRKEIDDFMKDPGQVLLFHVAYGVLQARPMDETLSYFAIGGIHGWPANVSWPRGIKKITQPGEVYYCVHGNATFCTWHRIYMLLIEQALHEIMMELVDEKTPDDKTPFSLDQRKELREAAEKWRMPYWDFAKIRSGNQARLPDAAMYENAMSPKAAGGPEIPDDPAMPFLKYNPLYGFRYLLKPGDDLKKWGINDINYQGNTYPFSIQQKTVRAPLMYNAQNPESVKAWKQGLSRIQVVNDSFKGTATNELRRDLCILFQDATNFYDFALRRNPQKRTLVPLNSIHGRVHNLTGGSSTGGNMAWIEMAGLDPIFFIYHCSIDRLIALYQAGNPGEWLTAADDNKTLPPFYPDANSPDNNFWTSKKCRNISDLGYDYEGLDQIKDRKTLNDFIKSQYGELTSQRGGTRGVSGYINRDYIATCQFTTHECGPFKLMYVVDIDGEEEVLGSIVNFVALPTSGCTNCDTQKEEGHKTYAATSLTPGVEDLFERNILDSMHPDTVLDFLTNKLTWKLVSPMGDHIVIDLDQLPSLKVAIVERPSDEAWDDASRGVGDFVGAPHERVLHGITQGKRGGLQDGEDFD